MTTASLGALDQPVSWVLEEVGRLLLRVRSLAPGGTDAWHVLVPETTQTVPAGSGTATIGVEIAFAGTEDVGATVTVAGTNAQDVDLCVFVNVGTTSPSWAYVGVVADTEPLPPALAIRLTTPASSLLSATHTAITAAITTTDPNPSLTLRLGRADLPTTPTSAKVSLTPLQITDAVAELLTRGLSLTGLALPASGSGTLTVQAPDGDTGTAALTNAAVPSMTDVLATLTRPTAGAPLGTAAWTVSVDQDDRSAIGQPSPTTVTWTANDRYDAAVQLVSKDPEPRTGLTDRTQVVTATAKSLPRNATAVLHAMPAITFGGTSPDPALAAPALHWTADARLAEVDLAMVNQAQPVNPLPPGGTPAPTSSARLVVTDTPRQVVLKVGQWDPNHADDTYVDLRLLDAAGAPDALGRLSAAVSRSSVVPALLAAASQQQVRVEGTAGPRKADLRGLGAVTVQARPRPVTTTQTVTTLDVHYLADAVRRAVVTLVDDDTGSTTVTADALPTEVTLHAQLPDAAALTDETATWSANARWTAAAAIPTVEVERVPSPTAQSLGQDALALTATVLDLPPELRVEGTNDGTTTMTELLWLAGAPVTEVAATVDLTRWSQPGAPYLRADGRIAPLPRGLSLGLRRSTQGIDLRYGGSDPVATADVTVTSSDLVAPVAGRHVPFDHARVTAMQVPATVPEPEQVATGPRLFVLLDTTPNQGLLAHVDVPAPVPALGEVHVRVVDDRPSGADVDTFPTPAGVRFVNRPRVLTDDLPGAPVGSLLVLTLPRLRSARYDGRDGQSLPTAFAITRGTVASEQPFGVDLVLDDAPPVAVEIAVDDATSSTWATGSISAAQHVVVDGQFAGTSDHGSHVVVELLPARATADAVVQRYDRDPAAQPAVGNDPASVAADRRARSSLARVLVELPARLEARLAAPHQRLDLANGLATTEPSLRRGSQVVADGATILTGSTAATTLAGWVSLQHGLDEDLQVWKDFCTDPETRVAHVVRRTTSSKVVPGPPEPGREVQTTGTGPTSLLTRSQVDAVVLARVERLRAAEASEQTTSAQIGSRPEQRFVALWNKEGWDLPFSSLHLENGQPTSDVLRGVVHHLDPTTEVLLTPEAWTTENGVLRTETALRLGNVRVEAEGTWEHGWPHVEPSTTTPTLTGTTTHRPDGLTACALEVGVPRSTQLSRQRHWEQAAPGQWAQSESWWLQCAGGLDAKGWLLADRPASSQDLVTLLQDAVASTPAPMVTMLQGNVRIPDYSPGTTAAQAGDPWFMRPGQTASPHSAAVALERLTNLELRSRGLCDDTQRAVPVFVSDDSASFQTGMTSTSVNIAFQTPTAAAVLQVVGREVQDWEDSPPLDLTEAMTVRVANGLPVALALDATSSVSAAPGKRPTSSSVITLSTTGSTALTNGPALGPGELVLTTLDTAANPWAPVVKRVVGRFTDAPGFVRLQNDSAVDVSRFPDGGGTALDAPGWDSFGAYDDDHSSTKSTRAWASGPLAGTIEISGADFRRTSSAMPSPWKAPTFDLKLIAMEITATPTGAVDLAAPPFALLTATRGPSGKEADAGMALCAACGRLVVDARIVTAARYGVTYASSAAPPIVTSSDDAAVLTLTGFSGKLAVQKRPGDLFSMLVIVGAAFGAALGSFWFAAFSIFVAEMALLNLLRSQSPIKVDDLCRGTWYLTPRPSTDLSLLKPFVHGWEHDCWPYHWDLNESLFVVLAAVLAGLGWAIPW